ncbi:MAG: hypothetical protein AUK47_15180 [Deltaproteobacteria bacterium CG2_30_63_29]|nr:MAG: hypothetical protein AUK47_15180 [Deltaproteobacteria bacterium CG2_30_63_29]
MEHNEHAEHPSTQLYFKIWGALVFLTVLTVSVTYLDMKKFALVTAMIIATTKCGLVASYFMHLRYQARIYSVLLFVALSSFGVFIILTFADMSYRFH